MKHRPITALAMLAGLLFVPLRGFAHHGSAAYDMTKLVTGKATVTSLLWANPHTMLNFDMKDDKGGVTHWSLEMFNPLWMSRAGWSKNTFKAGDEIEVTFHPAKNGSGNGYVRLPECKIIFHGQSINMDEAGAPTSSAPK
jgi:hypothetical protein